MKEIDFGEVVLSGTMPLAWPAVGSSTRIYRVLSKSLREDGLVDVELMEEEGPDTRVVTLTSDVADGTAERLGIGIGELVSARWGR